MAFSSREIACQADFFGGGKTKEGRPKDGKFRAVIKRRLGGLGEIALRLR